MQQWEYLFVAAKASYVYAVNGDGKSTNPFTWDFLNQKGREGWELVATTSKQTADWHYSEFILKRPLVAES